MPTDNPKISSYVPQAVYTRFKQFQDEHNLSMSQAVILILAEYFGLEQTVQETTKGTTVGGVTLARFEVLENSYKELLVRIEQLESKNNRTDSDLLTEPVDDTLKISDQDLLPLVELTPVDTSILLINLLGKPPDNINAISGINLSKRFNLSKDAVGKSKRKYDSNQFLEWSKNRDPDGIGWKYVQSPSKGYIPDGDLSQEQKSNLLKWITESAT